LFWLDMKALQSAHDFFLQNNVIREKVQLDRAFNLGPLQTIPAAERRV
jgi:hypothetical protein